MTKAMTPIERARWLLECPCARDAKRTTVVPADDVAVVCRSLIAAEERVQELERALMSLTTEERDGKPCWCNPESYSLEHDELCLKIQAALAKGKG